MKKVIIEGMSCEHCTAHVKNALEALDLTDVKVSLEESCATFVGEIDDEKLKEVIDDEGYDVISIENI